MRTRIGAVATALALAATIPLSAAVAAQDDSVTLTLLHNNDGESSLLPSAVEGVEYGGIARFVTEVENAPPLTF